MHIATAAQLMDSKSVMCPSAETTLTFVIKINHFEAKLISEEVKQWNSPSFPWLVISQPNYRGHSVSFEHPSWELLLVRCL